jgi:PAS domain S-box-containing protein
MLQPVKDEDGKVTGIYVEGFDVTPLVHAQQAAEHYARRLSAAVTLAQLGTFESNSATYEITLDDRAREIFGFRPDEHLTVDDLVGRIDSEDLHRLSLEDQAALVTNQKRREADYRIHLPDGSTRYVSAVGDLIAGPDGTPLWSLGLLEDITQRRRAEQRQRLLINELNHRVKNTLATVQSIASQTLRFASDLLEARASFEARLVALSAAHDLLTTQSWHGARLDELAAMALAPFESAPKPQISRSGPPVWLSAPRALALSLALHELATNAAKYGALAAPHGKVSLCWSVCEQHLTMSWVEEGGPPVASPPRSGFGTRLLQRNLAKELGGAVTVEFAPAGVCCEIRFAVQDPSSAEEPVAHGPRPQEASASFWEPHSASPIHSS